jgi:ribonuclease R
MKKTEKTKRTGKLNLNDLKRYILDLFRSNPKKRFSPRQVQKKLDIKNTKTSIEDALEKLREKKEVIYFPGDKYKINQKDTSLPVPKTDSRIKKDTSQSTSSPAPKANRSVRKNTSQNASPPAPRTDNSIRKGRVDMTRNGAAYIVCEGFEDDVYVQARKLNYAMNGDTVEVKVIPNRSRSKLNGEVIRVLDRANEFFIGTLRLSARFGFVTTDNQNMFTDIYVPLEDLNGAKDGEKVVVKVVRWQTPKIKSPIGTITDTLGKAGGNDIEMKSILIQNGFELQFPEDVLEESEALSEKITAAEIAKRRDFREVLTFTIDPDTAKDFDDALSLEYFDDGTYEVGIHIADVSHYVQPNSALDKEAYKRSTSVYLVDRVSPMLPEKISNVLCSLRPNEEKLTFSAVFTFDKKDKIIKEWFGKGVIFSDRRFTYEDAQEILEAGEGELSEELKKLNDLSKKLRKQRFKEGSVDFDAPEVKFILDDEGVPTSVYVKERKDSNMLIEDFMLLANRRVSGRVGKRENPAPFVYRIHDSPDLLKVGDFVKFANSLGYKMNIQTPEQIAQAYTQLLQDTKERPELKVLEPLAIRTMSKAVYSSQNIGHYGLGFEYYSHFTSPIRRYADVLVHRILEKNLTERYAVKKDELEEMCKHISAQERKATTAERQSVKYKQVEFMTKRLGETFVGIISGMIDRGFFVELVDNFCEGMVDFKNLPESYSLDESRLFAVGNISNKKIKMGDRVVVRILSADLGKRTIDMELAENENED